MFTALFSDLQSGQIAILAAITFGFVWYGPGLVAASGSRQSVRSLSASSVWDYQRGQTALRHATRLVIVVAIIAGAIRVVG